MAGEWLKMEACTPEKSEVLAITALMGWDDTDLTVGKLFRIWRWFDQQTTDGNARSVTPALLDRIAGVTGFCIAMQSAGWLSITEAGISLPNFDRHNGNTAKNRALTAKRVAQHKANARGNDEGNAPTVTSALPKEEKKRKEEEKRVTYSGEVVGAANAGNPTTKRATRLPDDWQLPKAWGDWAIQEFAHWTPDIVRLEADKFADHFRSKGGKDGARLDWQASWRNWCRSDIAQRTHAPTRIPRSVRPSHMTDEQRAQQQHEDAEKAKRLLFGDDQFVDVIEAQVLELSHGQK